MRTDVKVGITIAVCLAIVAGVWYFLIQQRGETGTEGLAATEGQTERTEETNVIDFSTPPEPTEIEPGYREETGPIETERPEVARRDTEEVIQSLPPAPAERTTDVRLGPAEPTGIPEVAEPEGGRPYVVKAGDNFWTIAAREYGNGALAALIQKANPKVPPRRMRPGMTIIIPPRPTARAEPTAPGVAPGAVETDVVTGKRFYVVKDGDRGFWGIAQVVYRHGKHYRLIEAANPGLDPRKLKAGQRVWVPEKPEAPVVLAAQVPERPASAETPGARVPARRVRVRTGAPTSARLPDGRVFD